MGIIWIKILFALTKLKNFLIKHWKLVLVLLGFICVVVYFQMKLNKQNEHITTLNRQTQRYVQQLERTSRTLETLETLQENTARQQESMIIKYQQDMENLSISYRRDIDTLRRDTSTSRVRLTTRFDTTPSEGTTSLSERFGIPVGTNNNGQ